MDGSSSRSSSSSSKISRSSYARFVDRLRHCWPRLEKWGIFALELLLVLVLAVMDCIVRGSKSMLKLSSAAHCLVLCCSTLCLAALSGLFCLSTSMVVAAVVYMFLGLFLALALLVMFAAVMLWMYGSFWTTSAILVVTGAFFFTNYRKLACALILLYSAYSAQSHCGWRGLLLCIGLAFIFNDLLIYLVTLLDKRRHKQACSPEDDDSTSVPTAACEPLAEEEVTRVLECSDHYAVLGFPRFGDCDESLVKREYRKKAMLVHPDKNKGNSRAEEAFKRLQNAYEVLLDTVKKKCYDEDLRKEDVLTSFRSSFSTHKNGRCKSADCACKQDDNEAETVDARPILCKTCRQLHMWIATDRVKQHARWCQDCEEFHPAKDGDGWVEQSFTSFFFGLFQKVNSPQAFACAGNLVYDVTEWAVCQGVKCPVNTHKPSFSVGSTGATFRGANSRRMPPDGYEDGMNEEEFYEWLQRAMGGGGGGGGGSSSNNNRQQAAKSGGGRKKRRGNKKQW